MPQEHASDKRYRRVGTAAIVVDFPRGTWSGVENFVHPAAARQDGPHPGGRRQ